MTRWTLAWALWLAAFVAIEVAAWRSGNYWHTLTGQVERVALAHPLAAVVVFAVVGGIVAHLAIDYVVLRLRP